LLFLTPDEFRVSTSAAAKGPTQYAVFDCLYGDGEDFDGSTFVRRKHPRALVKPSDADGFVEIGEDE